MNTLLCADNPDSLAWCAAVRDAWPTTAPSPLWWDGCNGSHAPLHAWRSRARDRSGVPRLFGSTSRGHGTQGLARLMADPIGPDVFVAQDYWGDVVPPSPIAGSLTYMVRDRLAAHMTAKSQPRQLRIEIVGAARMAKFEQLDISCMRSGLRGQWSHQTKAVLWLGQAPPVQAAYRRVLEQLADVLARMPNTVLLERPHGRQTGDQAIKDRQVWERRGVSCIDASGGELWPWLAAADVVVSCFSNGCVEAVHLNRASPVPCNRSLFILTDPELQAYHAHHSGLSQPPLALQGLALMVSDEAALPSVMHTALDGDALDAFWRGPLQTLVSGSDAARRIAHILCDPAYGATQ